MRYVFTQPPSSVIFFNGNASEMSVNNYVWKKDGKNVHTPKETVEDKKKLSRSLYWLFAFKRYDPFANFTNNLDGKKSERNEK